MSAPTIDAERALHEIVSLHAELNIKVRQANRLMSGAQMRMIALAPEDALAVGQAFIEMGVMALSLDPTDIQGPADVITDLQRGRKAANGMLQALTNLYVRLGWEVPA